MLETFFWVIVVRSSSIQQRNSKEGTEPSTVVWILEVGKPNMSANRKSSVSSRSGTRGLKHSYLRVKYARQDQFLKTNQNLGGHTCTPTSRITLNLTNRIRWVGPHIGHACSKSIQPSNVIHSLHFSFKTPYLIFWCKNSTPYEC